MNRAKNSAVRVSVLVAQIPVARHIKWRDTGRDEAAPSEQTIIALHAFLSGGLLPDPLGCGRLRAHSVERRTRAQLFDERPQQREVG